MMEFWLLIFLFYEYFCVFLFAVFFLFRVLSIHLSPSISCSFFRSTLCVRWLFFSSNCSRSSYQFQFFLFIFISFSSETLLLIVGCCSLVCCASLFAWRLFLVCFSVFLVAIFKPIHSISVWFCFIWCAAGGWCLVCDCQRKHIHTKNQWHIQLRTQGKN